jgi:hypothetical protein
MRVLRSKVHLNSNVLKAKVGWNDDELWQTFLKDDELNGYFWVSFPAILNGRWMKLARIRRWISEHNTRKTNGFETCWLLWRWLSQAPLIRTLCTLGLHKPTKYLYFPTHPPGIGGPDLSAPDDIAQTIRSSVFYFMIRTRKPRFYEWIDLAIVGTRWLYPSRIFPELSPKGQIYQGNGEQQRSNYRGGLS